MLYHNAGPARHAVRTAVTHGAREAEHEQEAPGEESREGARSVGPLLAGLRAGPRRGRPRAGQLPAETEEPPDEKRVRTRRKKQVDRFQAKHPGARRSAAQGHGEPKGA